MIDLNDELAHEYLAECREHATAIETALLALEKCEENMNEELANRALRAVHAIKGGASYFDLVKIRELADKTEQVLALLRSSDPVQKVGRVGVLLRATDKLSELIQNPSESNHADITEIVSELDGLRTPPQPSAIECCTPRVEQAQPEHRLLRILLAEDDTASRFLMQTFLSQYGVCHVAVNGKEAVDIFRFAMERGERFDLVCMDIMMPEMDGREAVRQVRALEAEFGILSTSGAKIIMTTAVEEVKEVVRCFLELCDSYLMKPIDLDELLNQMKTFHLVS